MQFSMYLQRTNNILDAISKFLSRISWLLLWIISVRLFIHPWHSFVSSSQSIFVFLMWFFKHFELLWPQLLWSVDCYFYLWHSKWKCLRLFFCLLFAASQKTCFVWKWTDNRHHADFLQQTDWCSQWMNQCRAKLKEANQTNDTSIIFWSDEREYKSFLASLICLLKISAHSFLCHSGIFHVLCRFPFLLHFMPNQTKQNKTYQMNYYYFTVWFFLFVTIHSAHLIFIVCARSAWAFVLLFVFHTCKHWLTFGISRILRNSISFALYSMLCQTQCSTWMPMRAHKWRQAQEYTQIVVCSWIDRFIHDSIAQRVL